MNDFGRCLPELGLCETRQKFYQQPSAKPRGQVGSNLPLYEIVMYYSCRDAYVNNFQETTIVGLSQVHQNRLQINVDMTCT